MAFDRRKQAGEGYKPPKKYSAPVGYNKSAFLRRMGWQDQRVLDEQPDDTVWREWEIFCLEAEEG